MQTVPAGLTHLRSLTGLRFYAALVVVLYHFSRYFEPMRSTGDPIVGFGYTGVSFFFILSGFVLTWSHRPGGTKRDFYVRRFARVWPLHALTVLLSIPVALIVGIPLVWEALPFVLSLTHAWIPPGEIRYAFNGPSWSLACEAFFYLLFPALIRPLNRWRNLPALMCIVFAGMVVVGGAGVVIAPERALGFLYYTNPGFRLGEFIIGIALALMIRRGWRPRMALHQALAATVTLYATLMLVTLGTVGAAEDLPYVVANLWMLPGFAAVIATAAAGDLEGFTGHLQRPGMVRLGQWSFALYLVHELVIKLADRFVDPLSPLVALIACSGLLVASIGFSGLLYEYFEQPVEQAIRRRATARVSLVNDKRE